jgi:alpha-tubulin suppressor-like RCC1 family protein
MRRDCTFLLVAALMLAWLPATATAETPTAAAGTVAAWGDNAYGQLGDGTTTERSTPATVPGLTDLVAVAAGDLHSLAIRTDGTVAAWGENFYGQLGDGTTTNRSTPITVTGLTDVTAVAAGDFHSLAVRTDGTVAAWGLNLGFDAIGGGGQLGDGTTTNRSTPITVTGLTDVVAIAAGDRHSLALRGDGTVAAWGANADGQLGDGTSTRGATPVTVTGLTAVVAVAAGGHHSLVLRTDGTVAAWGANADGQLGDGTTTRRATAATVAGLDDVIAVAGGSFHSLAVRADGTVAAWGWNSHGQLGDGTTTNRVAPITVTGLTDVRAVAGGDWHSLALVGVPDTAPPSVDITAPSLGAAYPKDAVATAAFGCVDEDGGSGIATCTASVDGTALDDGGPLPTTQVGTRTLQVTAIDHAGNQTTVTRHYVVIAAWPGPISLDSVNLGRAGQAYPVVFTLSGDHSLELFAAGSPASRQVACGLPDGTTTDITETATAGGSGLSYDPTTDEYTYVWKTAKSWSGTCRQLILQFAASAGPYADGQIILRFQFR